MDLRTLPRFMPPAERSPIRVFEPVQQTQEREQDRPSIIGGGLRAGFNELQGLGGAAVAAIGKATGAEGLENWGVATAAKNFAEAQKYGRPDLEVAPWREGGASALPWLGYQISKQGPQIAGALLATVATGGVGTLTGAAAATAGRTAAKQALKAGLGKEAAKAAARKAAVKQTVKGSAGGAGFSAGIGAGAMYNEAIEREAAGGPEATRGDALKALALSPVYGLAEYAPQAAIAKTALKSTGTVGSRARRIVGGAAVGAGAEGVTEGFQTYLENTFRPDLSDAEKARRIVDGALTGAAVGGTLRGAASARTVKEKKPQNLADPELENFVDESLNPTPEQQEAVQAVDAATVTESGQPVEQPVVLPADELVDPQTGQAELFTRPEMPATPRPFADYTPADLEYTANAIINLQSREGVSPQELEQAQTQLGLIADEIKLRQQETPTPPVPETQSPEVQPLLFDEEVLPETTVKEFQQQREQQEATAAAQQAEIEAVENAAVQLAEKGTIPKKLKLDTQTDENGQLVVVPANNPELAKAIDARDKIYREQRGVENLTEQQLAKRTKAVEKVRELTEVQNSRQLFSDRMNEILATEGAIDAIQERRAAQVDVRQTTQDGGQVAERDAQGQGLTGTGQVQEADQEVPRLVYRGGQEATFSESAPADTAVQLASGESSVDLTFGDLTKKGRVVKALRDLGLSPAAARTNADNIVATIREQGVSGIQEIQTPALNMRVSDPNFKAVEIPSLQNVVNVDRRLRTPNGQDVRDPAVLQDLANEGFTVARLDTPRGARYVELPQPNTVLRTEPTQPETLSPEAAQEAAQRLRDATIERAAYRIPPTSKITPAEVKQPVPFNRPGPGITDIPAAPSFKDDGTQKTVADVRAEVQSDPTSAYNAIVADPATPVDVPNSPQKAAAALESIGQAADKAVADLSRTSLERLHPTLQTALLKFQDMRSTIRQTKGLFKSGSLERYQEADDVRANLEQFLARAINDTVQEHNKLGKKAQPLLGKLMEYNQVDINYKLTWDEQPWLHNDKAASELKAIAERAHAEYRSLKQMDGGRGAKVLDSFADINQMIAVGLQASTLHQLILQGTDVTQVGAMKRRIGEDPVFELVTRRRLTNPAAMLKFMKKRRDELLAAAKQVSVERRDSAKDNNTPLTAVTSQLEQFLAELEPRIATEGRVQYFHLGRFGDFRLGFRIRTIQTEDGRTVIDPVAREAVARAYNNDGITSVTIDSPAEPVVGKTANNVFMKFETQREQVKAERIAVRLIEQGYIVEGSKSTGFDEATVFQPEDASRWSTGLITYLNANMLPKPEQLAEMSPEEQIILTRSVNSLTGQIHRYFLNTLPVSSELKLQQFRRTIAGYNSNMFRAYAHRSLIGVRGMASAGTAYERIEAAKGMAADIKDLQTAPGVASPRSNAAQRVLNEVQTRAALRGTREEMPLLGKIRAFNHVFYLGLSPAYVLLTALQVPVIALPKIGAKYGYAKTVGEMTKSLPLVTKVIRAMVANTKFGEAGFAALDEQALRNAGVDSDTDIKMIMDLMDTMTIDIGAQIRELGSAASNSLENDFDKVMRVAGGLGFYSEVAARLTTGIATHRMASARNMEGQALIQEVRNLIHTTMLDFTQQNVGRATGVNGIFGAATPLAFAFQQYNFQLLSMLYTETTNALRLSDATPAEVKQARKFLAWHAGMITGLAGTMGLPLASVVSRVAEEIINSVRGDEEEPINMDVLHRNFLSDVFGKGVGEVLARGIPRALGFDISARAGEQDILPFSKLIADRRSLKESFPDMAARTFGAPVGILLGAGTAAEKMAVGDVRGAMVEALPIALRNLIKSYDLADRGYRTSTGQVMPITPTGLDIMYQAMGLSPQQRANYIETANYERIIRGQAQKRKKLITSHITEAVRSGDREAFREWVAKAIEWDKNNPGDAITPTLSRTVKQRLKKEAIAGILNVPLNMRINDPAAWDRIRGANF